MSVTRRRRLQRADLTPRVSPEIIPQFPLDQLVPYEHNPRDNQAAIAGVRESIREFGFLIPIVVDSANVIVAGHTRVLAAQELGITHVPAVIADHLTEDQIKAFRLVDNKVAEVATWNVDLLSQEISHLVESGIDLTSYWTQEEIDCLSEVVADDCLSGDVAAALTSSDSARALQPSRTPDRTRCVIGEFVFHVPKDAYRLWANEIKEANDWEEGRVVEDLQVRLGMSRYLE